MHAFQGVLGVYLKNRTSVPDLHPWRLRLQAMRIFVGEPVWTPYNRPQEDHPSRSKYLQQFGRQAGGM